MRHFFCFLNLVLFSATSVFAQISDEYQFVYPFQHRFETNISEIRGDNVTSSEGSVIVSVGHFKDQSTDFGYIDQPLEWKIEIYKGKKLLKSIRSLNPNVFRNDGHLYLVAKSGSDAIVFNPDRKDVIQVADFENRNVSWRLKFEDTSWVDHFLCWQLYQSRFYYMFHLERAQEQEGEERLSSFEKAREYEEYEQIILEDYPNGIGRFRERTIVTPIQLSARLDNSFNTNQFFTSATDNEIEQTSLKQLTKQKRSDEYTYPYEVSFVGRAQTEQIAEVIDVIVTMRIGTQRDKKGVLRDDMLSWECDVYSIVNDLTFLEISSFYPATPKKLDGKHLVLATDPTGHESYMVVDLNNPSTFTVYCGVKWIISIDNNDWVDYYLNWGIYSSEFAAEAFEYANSQDLSEGEIKGYIERFLNYNETLVKSFPNGISKKRDKSLVTPKQLAGRLEQSISTESFFNPVTSNEKNPSWLNSTEGRLDVAPSISTNTSANSRNSSSVEDIYNEAIAYAEGRGRTKDPKKGQKLLFQYILNKGDDATYRRVYPEIYNLHDDYNSALQDNDYLEWRTERYYSMKEMLQHPLFVFPTLTHGMSFDQMEKAVRKNTPWTLDANKSVKKIGVYAKDNRGQMPSVNGAECKEMTVSFLKKNEGRFSVYRFDFDTDWEAEDFFTDLCAELANAGFRDKWINNKNATRNGRSYWFEGSFYESKLSIKERFEISLGKRSIYIHVFQFYYKKKSDYRGW